MSENSKPTDIPGHKPAAGFFTNYKALIAIGCGIAAALAILSFSGRVTTPNRDNQYFSYWAEGNRDVPVNVTDSIKVEVPIAFIVDKELSKIDLELAGEHAKLAGISLHDHTVEVIDGKVSSMIIIHFIEKPAIDAGTHYLTIIAKDPGTGTVIREGKIPLNYNMHEVIGKCSC